MTKRETLLQEIEELKKSINRMIEENPQTPVNSEAILKLSKKLDELIDIYYKVEDSSKRTSNE